MSEAEVIISRPLSVAENFFRSRTASGFYRNFQVTATYNFDLKKNNLQLLYYALRKTLIEYPILASNVQFNEKVKTYEYELLKEIKLRDVLVMETQTYSNQYLTHGVINEKFMKSANNIQFELYCQKPLFCLILIDEYNLSAVFEHTIGDGLVGNYFHEALLKNWARCENEGLLEKVEGEKIHACPDPLDSVLFSFQNDKSLIEHSLPPPMDIFLEDMDLDYTYGDNKFHERVAPATHPTKWTGRFKAQDTHEIAFKLINLTANETATILRKCKEKKVTLTPYIEIVLAYTLQPIFGDDCYATHKIAMTLRRHFTSSKAPVAYHKILNDPDYKILGTLAHMGFSENLPPITEFSWNLVQTVNMHLQHAIKNTRALNQLRLFKDTCDLTHDTNEQFFTQQLGKPKADAVKISNLGLINAEETVGANNTSQRKLTFKNMVFSQDMAPYGSEFMLSVISTPKGGLNLVLSYYNHSFDDSKWSNFDIFIERLKSNLMYFCSASPQNS